MRSDFISKAQFTKEKNKKTKEIIKKALGVHNQQIQLITYKVLKRSNLGSNKIDFITVVNSF